MELNITTEKKNSLLGRTEVYGTVTFEGATPSNAQVSEALAKKYGKDTDTVVVKHILGKFGGITATFEADVYDTKEQLLKTEPKKKEKAAGTAPAA
ncbi:30S ribosomal protein S24e [Candidatus Woesearchaeota archaeon]|nr:MAG: 30S ribosomal protein S24e [Candidatus Woesearchaeota archaeon]